jgi:hypothetical protein
MGKGAGDNHPPHFEKLRLIWQVFPSGGLPSFLEVHPNFWGAISNSSFGGTKKFNCIFSTQGRAPCCFLYQSQTYSNYKSHNTFKALVGISTTGAVVFISKLWGGSASDVEILSTMTASPESNISIKPLLLVISTSDAEPPHSFEMKTTAPVVLIPTSACETLLSAF